MPCIATPCSHKALPFSSPATPGTLDQNKEVHDLLAKWDDDMRTDWKGHHKHTIAAEELRELVLEALVEHRREVRCLGEPISLCGGNPVALGIAARAVEMSPINLAHGRMFPPESRRP